MLVLLPNILSSNGSFDETMPRGLSTVVEQLDGLIAETAKEGRAFLKRAGRAPQGIAQVEFNEHSKQKDMEDLFAPMKRGETWGYVSDAGLPCLADPGALLVERARELGIQVKIISGPSAIFYAIMHSGLNCQKFYFHGYLPKDSLALDHKLKKMEKHSKEEGVTEIWIETPYRNRKMLTQILEILQPSTKLAIASAITDPDEVVISQTVEKWKKGPLPDLDDKPTVFLLRA